MPSAALLVIGNEILSGKVVDTNSPFLAVELRSLGVDLERILTIPDDVEMIANEVSRMSAEHDFVFTSGGIGPTHDDLTMEGIARAFDRELELNQSMMERIERAQGTPPNESQRKMALIPADAQVIDAGDLWFPVVIVGNVHIFPGIPKLLQKKFHSIRDRFRFRGSSMRSRGGPRFGLRVGALDARRWPAPRDRQTARRGFRALQGAAGWYRNFGTRRCPHRPAQWPC